MITLLNIVEGDIEFPGQRIYVERTVVKVDSVQIY